MMWRQGVVPLTLVWTHGTRWLRVRAERQDGASQAGGGVGGSIMTACVCRVSWVRVNW